MTQDHYGRSRGTGYVVRGDAVAGDETAAAQAEQTGTMTTRLQRVASALRGDSPDQAAPDRGETTSSDTAVNSPVAAEATDDAEDPDATQPYEAVAVRYPHEGIDSPDPSSTGPDPSSRTVTAGSAPAPYPRPGSRAGTAEAGTADAGLRLGEATERLGDFGDIAFGDLLPDARQYTAQWQQIQFRFVDDPQGSVTEAAEVISQVTAQLEAAIQERQRAIQERQRAIQERAGALRGRWGEGSNADTETLRETLRMYRVFMDQLVGPTR